jgi:hypothetical protein
MVLRPQLFSHVRPSANRLAGWLFDWHGVTGEELPLQVRGPSWSLALYLVGCVFWVLRRLSPMQWISHTLFDADAYDPQTRRWRHGTPTTFTDGYLIASYLFSLTLIDWLPRDSWWIPLFWIVQVVQTTLYHTFWQSAVRIVPSLQHPGTGLSMEGAVATHQHLRHLALAALALVEVTWLFAVVYYLHFDKSLAAELALPSDAFYFSIGTTLLVGLGDRMQPRPDAYLLKYLMTAHVLCALALLGSIAARGVATVAAAPEPYGEPREE